MKTNTKLLATLGLFFLTQCRSKSDINNDIKIQLPSNKIETKKSLVNEWKYSNSIWYAAELTLHDNGTFTFHDRSCNGQKFSQGRWTNKIGIIQLTSFDAFKQKDLTESVVGMDIKKPGNKTKKREDAYSFIDFKYRTSPVLQGANDTVRIYLDNIQLQLKDDTLYCIGSNKLPEEAKFHLASKSLLY